MQPSLRWIKTATEGKAGLGRYGKKYELIIAVEDNWFDPDDTDELVAFIKSEVLTLPWSSVPFISSA